MQIYHSTFSLIAGIIGFVFLKNFKEGVSENNIK
jgi:hypothetical protein